MTRRKLPIGLQTFRTLREADCYYVDKTPYIRRLMAEGTHYFLSRPRRFGKSLFLDTLKELFEGSETLFAGLDIHRRWDWSVRHPVVRLDFSGGDYQDPDGLRRNVMAPLDGIERWAQVTVGGGGGAGGGGCGGARGPARAGWAGAGPGGGARGPGAPPPPPSGVAFCWKRCTARRAGVWSC